MNAPATAQRPLYFLHLHKCGGTTFLQAAAANRHAFACPGNAGMPFPAKRWAAMRQPFVRGGPVWEFWKEPRQHIVERRIAQMLKAGVTCITQEWGHYSPDLWRRFTRAVCVRHPINRLYSDFLHRQEERKFPEELTFHDWVGEERPGLDPTLFFNQLGIKLNDFIIDSTDWKVSAKLCEPEKYPAADGDPIITVQQTGIDQWQIIVAGEQRQWDCFEVP